MVRGLVAANQRVGELDIRLLSAECCVAVRFLQPSILSYCNRAVHGEEERVAIGQDGFAGRVREISLCFMFTL